MRNAVKLPNGEIVTIDNAGCLGELAHDAVVCPNDIVSYFTARTALFEQLCAGSMPHTVLLANFTGDAAWDGYMKGIERAFHELQQPMPTVVGSTESNFTAVQSGISLTMLGSQQFEVTTDCTHWYVVGVPLVGQAVLDNVEKCAPLGWLYAQLKEKRICYIHPIGSGGIAKEAHRLFGEKIQVNLAQDVSGGPATAVIVGAQQPLTGFDYIEEIFF